MSQATTTTPTSGLSRLWHKWRFHLNILLLLIPLGFMPKYFADAALFRGDSGLGERELGKSRSAPGACAWQSCAMKHHASTARPVT